MACSITSLILVAMFAVVAMGLVDRAGREGSPPPSQDRSPVPSRSGNPPRSSRFPGTWWARLRMSAR
jgi:hypothetical protein